MSTDAVDVAPQSAEALRNSAGRHLWRHFTDMTIARDEPLPIMVKGDGCYLEDIEGRRYLDGLSNLICVNLGYSHGVEIGEAAAGQLAALPYHANWHSTTLPAIELAEEIADLAPDGLDHVFFTPSGGESVEAALKIARQYFTLRGERRWKVIGRNNAYHGTSLGALTLNGVAEYRAPFEPLSPSAGHVRNTCRYRRPEGETEEQFTTILLDELEQRVIAEGPDTVAMMVMEPVQNHGGCLVPPVGYSAAVRELCDRYGILLLADEVITAFGRVGAWFASERYDIQPDLITIAKGMSSAYGVIGAVIASQKVYETFDRPGVEFVHGNTFGGHPVQTAVALKSIEIMKREEIPQYVRDREGDLRATLESLYDLPIVGDIRGAGFFFIMELVKEQKTKAPFEGEAAAFLEAQGLTNWMADEGVLFRIEPEGGAPQIYIAPPLVAGSDEFEQIGSALRNGLTRFEDKFAGQ